MASTKSPSVSYTPGYINPNAIKPDVERELKRIADSLRNLDLKNLTWRDIQP